MLRFIKIYKSLLNMKPQHINRNNLIKMAIRQFTICVFLLLLFYLHTSYYYIVVQSFNRLSISLPAYIIRIIVTVISF